MAIPTEKTDRTELAERAPVIEGGFAVAAALLAGRVL